MKNSAIPASTEVSETAELATSVDTPLTWNPFPVGALPEPWRSYVPSVATSVQVDPAMVALPALVASAAAIGATRSIQLSPDWREPCILWGALVATSGDGKSPAARAVMSPAYQRDSDAQTINEERLTEFRQHLREFDVDRKAWEKLRAKGEIEPLPIEPQRPTLPRFTVGDVTVEKLAEILADSSRSVLMIRDELAALMGGFERYSGGRGGAERSFYLSLFTAETTQVDRKTGDRRSLTLENPHLSIYGGVQPGLLHNLLSNDDLAAGLPARFLFMMPPCPEKRWRRPAIPPEQTAAVERLFGKLYALGEVSEWEPAEFGEAENGLQTKALPLTAEADAEFGRFYEAYHRERKTLPTCERAAWPKLIAYCGRLALVLELVENPAAEQVGLNSVQQAITLTRWFSHEARRVYAMRYESAADRETREVLQLVERNGGVLTARELQQQSRQFKKAMEAEIALGKLQKAKLGDWHTIDTGGRQRTEFRLHKPYPSTEGP